MLAMKTKKNTRMEKSYINWLACYFDNNNQETLKNKNFQDEVDGSAVHSEGSKVK